ncbi:hypothetical protein PMAYCL1PPCAC_02562, partial [Pristionchus mayeri]
VSYSLTLVISTSSVDEDVIGMSSFFPFLSSTPRKGSASADSVTLDSSAVDVDRISLVSNCSTIPGDEKEGSSDLYMSVQASPTGSCEEEEESYLTAGSTRTGELKLRPERKLEEKHYSPSAIFPDGPAWFELQHEILNNRGQRITGRSEEEDLFDLGSLVAGIREELRWKKSLAANERMRKLISEFDSSYNPLEGPSSATDESDLVIRLKNTPSTNSVVIPSPTAGIDEMSIEKSMRIPPHELAQRVLLNDFLTVFPRDEQTDDGLSRTIHLSNMLLVPSISSSSPSSSTNRSVTTVWSVSKGTEHSLGTVGGVKRVKDQWILDTHPARTPSKILESQGYQCAECGRVLEGEYAKRIRYCDYFGAVFCLCCSFSAKGIIPARILKNWHFREYPLSDRAAAFLAQVREKPVIRMNEVAPILMEKMRSLKQMVALRPRLRHASTYVRYCAMAARCEEGGMSLPDIYSSIPAHLIEEDDLFSLVDLARLYNGVLLPQLEGAFSIARDHVERCRRPTNELISVCKDRAFTCWLCSSESDLIFSFQSDRARRCDGCGSFSHSNCFRKAQKDNRGFEPECSKCKRMQESRIRRRFISTCGED